MSNNNNGRKMKLSSREESRVFSRQSVLSVMDRFVQAVDNMNDTVMVPSRLMDISNDVDNDLNLGRGNNDYHAFYSMLNAMKNELLWGGGAGNEDEAGRKLPPQIQQQGHEKGGQVTGLYQRRLSTVSSLSLSDSEADTESLSESDSGREMEFVDQTTVRVARNFRHHLFGLYNTLNQLTDSALVLTCRYQEEIDVNGSS